MIELSTNQGVSSTRSTQAWVRVTGTSIDVAAHPWLLGPGGGTEVVADDWLPIEAKQVGGVVAEGGGLVDRVNRLNGPGFDAPDSPHRSSSSVASQKRRKWGRAQWAIPGVTVVLMNVAARPSRWILGLASPRGCE